ncbi:deoxynucleoside triphosphate triphosphohydrolase SAMHD1-like [Orbicella faveolata]|uniref:deoxynucleoside triphosphate triphosphohydrolase SAMHD1-like n=1 Tax=Orbicella faveolata TaxID=48498 RepID=UPI0009E1E12D|nr:deoxynucleoside triphosphate triphosphohydrolase SAMHD1-like [Orbicella faveolata]
MFDALFIPTARPESHWKHEDASVRMFDHMLEVNNLLPTFAKYNLVDKDVTFVKELISGAVLKENSAKVWPYKGRGPDKSYLYEIVANKRTGIDVDKFDYFSRDCHCLGISNSFDHKRYMKFARVINVKGKLQICVRDKEAGNIYDMFHTRNSLFRRAYQHKTSNIIERMITEALLKADRTIRIRGSHGKMLCISETIDDMEAYSQLSDAIYYQILHSTDPALEEARNILLRIEKRDLYKCIGSTILKKPREKEEIPDIQLEIAGSIDEGPFVEPEDFVIDVSSVLKMLSISETIDDMEAYSQLSDAIYYQILHSTDPALEEARNILLRIEKRDLYKCIGSTILKKPREKEEIPDIQLEIAGSIDEGPFVEPEDFVIDIITFDYGMRDRNPIDAVRFYQKNNPNKPIILRKDEVSNMLPENFVEQHLRVYFRKNDPESLKKAKGCFILWCQGQQCTTPKGGDSLAEFTPMKSSQESGQGNPERCLTYDD